MNKGLVLACGLVAALGLAFLNSSMSHESNEQGCAGSNCHAYKPGLFDLKPKSNLKVSVKPVGKPAETKYSAELLDASGQIIDFCSATTKPAIMLNAPKPGKYQVRVGVGLEKPVWDSMSVEIKPAMMSIPTSRYGTSTLKFFDSHPNTAHRASLARFILPEELPTELNLYTPDGRLARKIFKGRLGEGIHSIHWETRDERRRLLDSGVYLLELKAGTKTLVQQIQIVK